MLCGRSVWYLAGAVELMCVSTYRSQWYGLTLLSWHVPKTDALRDLDITWHFIGHLQTNKVRDVIGRVQCIQSVTVRHLLMPLHPSVVNEMQPWT